MLKFVMILVMMMSTTVFVYALSDDQPSVYAYHTRTFEYCEGVSDSLYAEGVYICTDSTYSARWTSATCNYQVDGVWVQSKSI